MLARQAEPDKSGLIQCGVRCDSEALEGCRYKFTKWAVSLNTMSPGLEKLLPPSDMRWRKDVRALEEGRYGEVNAPSPFSAPSHCLDVSRMSAASFGCT